MDRMRYKQTKANTRRQGDTYNNYGQGRYDARQNEQYDRRNERYNGRQNERYERRSNDQYNTRPQGSYQRSNNRGQIAFIDYGTNENRVERQVSNDGYNINLEKDRFEEFREYPNENAPAEVEIVGAVY